MIGGGGWAADENEGIVPDLSAQMKDDARVYRLHFLGPVQIEQAGRPLRGLRSRKALALLAFLALHEGAVSRTVLADFFWPDQDERHGRANLSWALNHIKTVIPEAIVAERDALRFNSQNSALWLDTRAFTRLLDQGTAAAQMQAVELMRGDLLDGLWLRGNAEFELWLRAEQERWRRLAADTLSALGDHFQQVGQLAEATAALQRLIRLTPWRESAHRRLMRLLAEDGQRSAALAQYEVCRTLLRQELNVAPSPATENLAAAIRENSFAAPMDAAAVHHLPRQYSVFFGREAELARIDDLLAAPQTALVAVIGPGGVGKTRLALAAAEAQKARFAHGVHFLPLADLGRADQLFPALAELLGFSFSSRPDRPPQHEQLLAYLAQQEMLLVLDNMEHLEGVQEALLAILRQAPGIKMLATSRHEPGLQAAALVFLRGLPVPPPRTANSLDTFPAMGMLLDRVARRDDVYTSLEWQPALADVCRLVEGYPLALELAAGLIPAATPQQIVDQIRRSLDTLRVTYHDMPPRHLSLRALFDHSWNLLSAEEQRLLPRLTVFRGGFTADAAGEILGASPALLRGLTGKSLLQFAPDGRFTLHNIPRQFLSEKMAPDPALAGAHASFYTALFRDSAAALRAAGQVEVRQRLQHEEENLRAAWEWTYAQGERAHIAASLPDLHIYWARRGYARAGVDFFDAAIETLRNRGWEDVATAVRLHALGCLTFEEAGAQKYVEEALSAAADMRRAGPQLKLGMAARLARHCMACLTVAMSGDKGVERLLAESSEIVLDAGSELDCADLDVVRARMAAHEGDYSAARQALAQAVEAYRRLEDWYALADALYQLARLQFRAGSFAAAATCATECQELYARLGNRQGLQDSHTALGFVAYQAGAYEEAAAAFETSLRLARELGNHGRIANNLSNLGAVAMDSGRLEEARAWFEQAHAKFSELNEEAGIAIVLANQGLLAEKVGDTDQGLLLTQESLGIRQRLGDRNGLLLARNNLGYIRLTRQEYQIALEQFQAVLVQGSEAENANYQADALGGIAIVWVHTGRAEEGIALAGTVLAEEATSRYVRDRLDDFLQQLIGELSPQVVETLLARGRERPFAEVVESLIGSR